MDTKEESYVKVIVTGAGQDWFYDARSFDLKSDYWTIRETVEAV